MCHCSRNCIQLTIYLHDDGWSSFVAMQHYKCAVALFICLSAKQSIEIGPSSIIEEMFVLLSDNGFSESQQCRKINHYHWIANIKVAKSLQLAKCSAIHTDRKMWGDNMSSSCDFEKWTDNILPLVTLNCNHMATFFRHLLLFQFTNPRQMNYFWSRNVIPAPLSDTKNGLCR